MNKHDLRLILIDLEPGIVREWERWFARFPEVEILEGDLTEAAADAYVSPANSYGWMDGGIDRALRERFAAGDIERRVQEAIAEVGGRLPVGMAMVVETGDDETPYLISAPTMETPSDVSHTDHAYRAMKALLEAIQEYSEVGSVAIPGLCTGVGCMSAADSARQMSAAYAEWLDA
jgi:O-acetyl-ADP-ribose deacetylase (regulator of RNase III)